MNTRHWIAAAALLAQVAPANAANVPHAGEIMMMGSGYCPAGWIDADGRMLPVSGYPDLFAAIGTTYGGDGRETFALPNLASRVPVGQGTMAGGVTFQMGETGPVLAPFADFGQARRNRMPAGTVQSLAMRYCVALTQPPAQ